MCQGGHVTPSGSWLGLRLVSSAAGGDSDIVKLLLAHGAEPSRPFWNANMHPPLYEAALGGHQDIVKALLDAGADFGRAPSPLHNVSDPDVLGLLLEAGANVESVEWNGETPLVRAVCRGDFEVRYLACTIQICMQRPQPLCMPPLQA